MLVWRISNYVALDGEGGLRAAARWHSAGRRIVYTADHPAAALAEMMVHVPRHLLPETYQLLKISVPAAIKVEPARLTGKAWKDDLAISQGTGDAWLRRGSSAILKVPSVIVPDAWNYLVNPMHPDARKLRILDVIPFAVDTRLT